MRTLQLFAALGLAAFGVSFAHAENRLSVSFDSTVSGSTGAISTPAEGWVTGSGSSGTITLKDYDGTNTVTSAASLTYSASTTWGYGTSADGDMSLLARYLDDSTSGTGATITVTNIPYATYDVYIYCATDTGSRAFTAVTVNDTSYTYSSGTVEGSAEWGASQSASLVEGTNYLHVTGQNTSTLTIVGGLKTNTARGGIAGIQIVNTGDAVTYGAYSRTLTSTGNWTDFTWVNEAGETAQSIPTTPTVTGVTLTTADAGSTLTMDASAVIGTLTVGGTGALTFATDTDGDTLTAGTTTLNVNTDASAGVSTFGALTLASGVTLKTSSVDLPASSLSMDSTST